MFLRYPNPRKEKKVDLESALNVCIIALLVTSPSQFKICWRERTHSTNMTKPQYSNSSNLTNLFPIKIKFFQSNCKKPKHRFFLNLFLSMKKKNQKPLNPFEENPHRKRYQIQKPVTEMKGLWR